MRSLRLSALKERLLRAGVAPRRVSRIMAELEDHLDDLLAELAARGLDEASALAEAHERLGSEDALLASVLARPELKPWASRRPAVAFGLLPLPVFAASFVALIVVLFAILSPVNLARVDPGVLKIAGRWLTFVFQWALPAATAVAFTTWAFRRRVPWLWPAVGILIVAIVGALTNFGVTWPHGAMRGTFGAGIGISTSRWAYELSRVAATVAIALLVSLAGSQLRKRAAPLPRPAGEPAS